MCDIVWWLWKEPRNTDTKTSPISLHQPLPTRNFVHSDIIKDATYEQITVAISIFR